MGYGDANPSNISLRVRGAEMRVAETRAVNHALRKAYGIGICSVIYSRYHCYLDYPSYRIILEPTAEANKPFPERETYGLTLLASGADLHTYTVASVRPGSPAEADGFQKGDLISGEDGKRASEFTLRELRESLSKAGQHHALEVQRSGGQWTTNMDVRLTSIER